MSDVSLTRISAFGLLGSEQTFRDKSVALVISYSSEVTDMKERDKKIREKKRMLKEVLKKKLKDLQVKPGKETVSQPFIHNSAS